MEEVEQYILQVQNNPDVIDEYPMNNSEICFQIAICEVFYHNIWHINPVLVEVDMEFYHSFPIVQNILGDMTRLESVAMSRDNANTTTTASTTVTPTAADQPQFKICTEKDT